jgi:tetratricopeptide (TPR) repeat protein
MAAPTSWITGRCRPPVVRSALRRSRRLLSAPADLRGSRVLQPGSPLTVAVALLALLLAIVLSGVRTSGSQSALATPTPQLGGAQLPFSTEQIAQFRRAAESSNTAATWAALGNALFDNLQTLREYAPQSPQYRNGLSGWLDVVQAYDRAIALEDSPVLRADRALALFNYGSDAPDPRRVAEALAEVERGIQNGVTEPRALLNYGLILALHDPPRISEALAQWRKILEVAPQSNEARQAQSLLQTYEP